ncbi:ATP phosphoribosyltransferase regulatory subunit [Halovulum dunhuangense]|uniref:ATP phosphoribosyltransferase regulatory subunit n=1 Tax=Halovulum dunhuangense TaxID=1505036 RepID=A0A849L4K7_9RHOB|nr:ATP phosphoribosyltransferase regulatory subunit [Halovulum dunhuangense]NNU81285.1 ATP phosphoribosyltransferase regulatory subunit [Halovulum dunhuangense]
MIERAYLDDARTGAGLARLEAEVARLMALFAEAGAVRVDPAALLPADTLLDLYGEDIRARAFATQDGEGELVLRPDFTVPIVQRHMEQGAEPARYAYAGPVWRRQGAGSSRAREYLQVGFELFDGANPAAADAEVFALIATALEGCGLRAATGDLGLLMAAIEGLTTSPARRAALRRHLWRPARFHRLLDRFAAPDALRPALDIPVTQIEAAVRAGGKPLGKRAVAEVVARIHRLQEEAASAPLHAGEVAVIEALLDLRAPAPEALSRLRDLAAETASLRPAVDRFARRLDALAGRGVSVDALPFEGAFGRTTLEYYDGFVFGFYAEDREDLPVIASGGRYDALTRVLGAGQGVPAVGGMIRPEALLALEAGR